MNRSETYSAIQNNPFSVGESDLVSFLDQSRLDPRLMEVCIEFIRDFWYILDPSILNKKAKAGKYPFMIKAAAVLVLEYCQAEDVETKKSFQKWMKSAVLGIKDPAPQLMYIEARTVGSILVSEALDEAIPALFNHGLVESSLPFNKGLPQSIKNESWAQARFGVDAMKAHYASKVKALKATRMPNASIEKLTGINRVFLSRILNNKLNGISLEYLVKTAMKAEKAMAVNKITGLGGNVPA